MIEHPGADAPGPGFSGDGKWWFNGQEWVPASESPNSGVLSASLAPAPATSASANLRRCGSRSPIRTGQPCGPLPACGPEVPT